MSEYIIDFTDANYTVEPIEHNGEIVRCRDCKHYKDRNGAILPSTVCQRLGYYNFKVEPDGFCAWALRKEVDE